MPQSAGAQTVAARHVSAGATREVVCDVTGALREAALVDRADFYPGDTLHGPALITEPQTTTFVSADFRARIDGRGNIWLLHETQQEDAT
jgi:N-methylhydantoinase A